jgi:hypothetical protein
MASTSDVCDQNGNGLYFCMSAELLLAQFGSEVMTRCKLIRTNADAVAVNLQSAMELVLIGIPECVRKMPLRIVMKTFEGDIQQAAAHFSPAAFTQLGSGTGTQPGNLQCRRKVTHAGGRRKRKPSSGAWKVAKETMNCRCVKMILSS